MNMKIRVKNIGVLQDAEVEINGITVVAGKNNTGKSTFGKALFAVYGALVDFENRVLLAKKRILLDYVEKYFTSIRFEDFEVVSSISKFIRDEPLNEDSIRNIVKKVPESSSSEEKVFFEKASKLLTMDDSQLRNNVITAFLKSEFGGQLQNKYKPDQKSEIDLLIGDRNVFISICDEKVELVKNARNMNTFPVYLDEFPLLQWLDRKSSLGYLARNVPRHTVEMIKLIRRKVFEESDNDLIDTTIKGILQKEYLKEVWGRLEEICHGDLVEKNYNVLFVDKKEKGVEYPVQNLSAGLRCLIQLQELILNGVLSENGIVIMDEPEIHLHPEWQVVFAEMIVLLQKSMNLRILLTSHSPYFISALDAFAKKYNVIDNSRYYFAIRNQDNRVEVQNVTGSVHVIYDSLAKPYQTIADVFME